MSGRPTLQQVTGWADELTAVAERIGPRFARGEPRRRVTGYIANGPRLYEWARFRMTSPEPDTCARWVLIRRSPSDPADVAYFACGGPLATTPDDLARVAGARWATEDHFEPAKGDCGLDECEVRGWTGWHRHWTFSMFALAVLAVIRSGPRSRAGEEGGRT